MDQDMNRRLISNAKENKSNIESITEENTISANEDKNSEANVPAPSHYEELVHPNMEHSASQNGQPMFYIPVESSMRNYEGRQKKDCKYYFSKLDYEILRPLFIYKYERDEMHR